MGVGFREREEAQAAEAGKHETEQDAHGAFPSGNHVTAGGWARERHIDAAAISIRCIDTRPAASRERLIKLILMSSPGCGMLSQRWAEPRTAGSYSANGTSV
jgi:hypothetical protein